MVDKNLFNVNRSLFDQVCSEHNLLDAFRDVKRNKGVPGVDDQTVESFASNLQMELSRLSKELKEWRYKPRPVKRVEIPKNDNKKELRKLGIPCVRDRIVQACLKRLIEPIFEPSFSTSSYGFRPGRKQHDAIQTSKDIVNSGKEWVVDIDLEKFYDTIPHDRLIYRLSLRIKDKRVLRLIGNILRSGVLIDGRKYSTSMGAVQGSPLSPLLSNVVLDELDKELEKRELEFVRWADDANIFVRSEKAAQRVMHNISKFIEKRLKLKVNMQKSKIALSKHVKFLGMTIVAGTVAISAKSMARAMEKVKQLTPTNCPIPVEVTIKKVNDWYKDWIPYHSITQYPSQFRVIEAHVRRRLRARIVRQSKRPKYFYRKLMKRGVSKKVAFKNAYSNKGPWKRSHHAMNHAFSVSWFVEETGQLIMSNKKLSHWLSVDNWIRLT